MNTTISLLCACDKRVDIEVQIHKQARCGGVDTAKQETDGKALAHLCYTTLPSGTMDAFFAEYAILGFRSFDQPITLDKRPQV